MESDILYIFVKLVQKHRFLLISRIIWISPKLNSENTYTVFNMTFLLLLDINLLQLDISAA